MILGYRSTAPAILYYCTIEQASGKMLKVVQ
jgi:hypothetical protein